MSTVHAPAPVAAASLPSIGMSRWSQLSQFIPVSREKWRQLVNSGKAPQPVRLSERCTMYRNEDVHRWLANPVCYRQAEGDSNA